MHNRRGRPGIRPLTRAASNPAFVRSEISARSNSAIAPATWNTSLPTAVVVSMLSDTERKADGTYKPIASLITVTGNVTGGLYDDPNNPVRGIIGGILYSSLPDGATAINATLVFARYTPYALDLLN